VDKLFIKQQMITIITSAVRQGGCQREYGTVKPVHHLSSVVLPLLQFCTFRLLLQLGKYRDTSIEIYRFISKFYPQYRRSRLLSFFKNILCEILLCQLLRESKNELYGKVLSSNIYCQPKNITEGRTDGRTDGQADGRTRPHTKSWVTPKQLNILTSKQVSSDM